ncbi:MAG: hypothetical protein KJ050_09135 [Candidatus Omnitrophica bacterium]|nr:hypothetical protein [bacterium]MBW7937712.1 hypothetical protein [Candidatus Omnitrophota bacterium]MBV6482284.1 hypothetical protein [bacterium]MCC6734282.1 hypothetical protein [Candidatus Omnitrophota bacterium]MCK6497111.1 hypothetical protein [bacterium]
MPGIDALSNIPGGLMPTETPSTPSSNIDREGFLRLLVAQLQNQDPLEPLTNEEFVQQLTSFSSLDELREIRKGMEGLGELEDISKILQANLALQQTNVNAMAVGLIGKKIEAVSDTVKLGSDSDSEIVLDVPASGANEITLELKGSSGNTLYQMTINPSNPPEGVRVDGNRIYVEIPSTDANGNPLPSVTAKIVAAAKNGTTSIPLETTLLGVVEGIDFRGEKTLLNLGGTDIDIVNVLAVNNPN